MTWQKSARDRPRTRLATGPLLALAMAACGGTAPPPNSSSTAELEAIYWSRTDSARMRFTETDIRFVTGMIGHHAQALVMGALAPTHGASSSVQILAARIINSQQDEVSRMQQWLSERGEPVPEVMIEGTEFMVHGTEYALHMPGMLTPDQMRKLDEAQGTEFDNVFLMYMIQHHRGAVTMVEELFGQEIATQDEAVFKLAADIQADQLTEIVRMGRMLAALSGLPLSGAR